MSGIVPNITGQQTMANSEPVVIASDQSAIPITGTVSVGAVDNTSLYNNTISAVGAITGIDTTGYQSLVVQINGTWVGNMWFEGSNDNLVWGETFVTSIDDGITQDIINTNGLYQIKVTSKYIRLNVLQLSSGSITALILGRTVQGISAADLLSYAMDKNNNSPLYVSEVDTKKDNSKALVPSDAPLEINGSGTAANSILFIIDTTGYQTIAVQLFGTWAGTVTFTSSNIKTPANFVSILGYTSTGGQIPVSTATANGLYIFPCSGKFFRLQVTAYTSGNVQASAFLRQQPFPQSLLNIPSVNTAQYGGTTVVNAGVAGVAAIGGNIATGAAQTTNPVVIGGVDTNKTPLTRRIQTDTTGRIINAVDSQNVSRVIGALPPSRSTLNIPSASVQDTAQFEGQSQIELLSRLIDIGDNIEQIAKSQDFGENLPLGVTGGVDITNNSPVTIGGLNDINQFKAAAVTEEGHLEVAIHSPLLPFGSIHTENLTPIFQSDAVYGLNTGQVSYGSTLSGTYAGTDSNFVVTTGTTTLAQGFIQSVKRLRYRAGQGVVGRFAGSFTSPVPYSYQVIGFGHAEDGVYFGYKDISGSISEFGILYVNRGQRDVRTLTVTVGATSASNCTITLNGVAFTVPLTAASNIQRTVYEISQFVYAGWSAYPASSTTVIFVRDSAGTAGGTYSFGAGTTGAAASIASTRAGAASTENFYPQSQWNGDKLDGSGASGVRIDPTKGNVYQINIQYLGYGTISFKIEGVPPNANNAVFITVHTIKLPNTLSTTSFRNPSFPFTMAAYSAGSTTNLTLKVGSFAGFIEGVKTLHGNRFSYVNSLTTVGATNFQALFTIYNGGYYGGIPSQVVINILSVAAALKHTSPCIIYLIKNGTLAGNPSFSSYATNSASLIDTAATTVTYTANDQLIWSGHLGDTGELSFTFGATGNLNMEEITLQPYEWVTLAAKAVTGTPSYVTGSINTREDQ